MKYYDSIVYIASTLMNIIKENKIFLFLTGS
jgi:hypothetical protein